MAKIGSLHLAVIGSVYFTVDISFMFVLIEDEQAFIIANILLCRDIHHDEEVEQ